MSETASHRAMVWLRPEQTWFVRDVAERAGLKIVAAGGPERGRSADAVRELGAARAVDDLRAGLAAADDVDLVLLATTGPVASDPGGEDSQALRACRARGVQIVSFEPIPASVLEIAEPVLVAGGPEDEPPPGPTAGGGLELARFCPLVRASRTMRGAAEIMQEFGPARTVIVEAYCTPAQGSLGARLFDAMDLVLALVGEPERIDAACVLPQPPGPARALRAVPGETLRDLHGTLTANLRFSDGRTAAVVLSDMGGRWNRTVTLLGGIVASGKRESERAVSGGRLRIFEDGDEWIAADGTVLDTARDSGTRRKRGEPGEPLGVLAAAEQIAAILEQRATPIVPTDYTAVLSMCGAALLSARTGEGESPATIRKMIRAG